MFLMLNWQAAVGEYIHVATGAVVLKIGSGDPQGVLCEDREDNEKCFILPN